LVWQPFKCQVSALAGALFNSNAHCATCFPFGRRRCTFNGLPSSLFPSNFLSKFCMQISHTHATCPAYPILLNFIKVGTAAFRILYYAILSHFLSLHPLGPSTLFSTLFSKTLNWCPTSNVSTRFCKTTSKLTALYILISTLNWHFIIPYILESNPHLFYSFRGLKNQMWIRFAV
jgi:hypothetical protein